MPTTRTGRQSSPSKEVESPSKTRVQPLRGARLRSASPFFDAVSASTSAAVSQQPSQASSPSKVTRASPRKKAAASSSTLQLPARSTRSRSRSVTSDGLETVDEDEVVPLNASDAAQSGAESSQLIAARSTQEEPTASPEPGLAPISEGTPMKALLASVPQRDDEASDSASSSGSSSDSSSDNSSSDNSSSGESESDSSSDDDDQEADAATDLDALLKASQQAYKSRAPASATQSRFEDNQDVISFDADENGAQGSKKANKVMPLTVRAKHQMSKNQPAASKKEQSPSKSQLDKQIENPGQVEVAADKKRSKHARTVQTSAGSNWFDMPEFGASASKLAALKKQSASENGHAKVTGGDARLQSAEQLRREVQALRLRNALDPKRFYRASAKNAAMPKFAQLGKIIASPLEPKAVMSRQERGRTVVEELIRDAEAAQYSKRKFAESQASHKSNYNGRRKPPSKKRRT